MKTKSKHPNQPFFYEAEVTEGLEFVSSGELTRLGAVILDTRPGEIGFRFAGDPAALVKLATVQSISSVQHFAVPRPRALLGNVEFPLLIAQIQSVLDRSPRGTYRTFHIAAAGSDSNVMQRLKAAIAERTGLTSTADKGDLWLRIRPGRAGGGGWETLVRLTPRPLVTRAWRVCNLEGALNAADARALVILTQPQPADVFVNLGCGSGTLLIERADHASSRRLLGFDHDAAALRCAQANTAAAGALDRIHLQRADMTRLPLPDQSVDALCADLPFGQLTGSHADNQRLYPRVLVEAARVAKPGARFVLITHEVRLMESLLPLAQAWQVEQAIRVNLRGLHPRIYRLLRR